MQIGKCNQTQFLFGLPVNRIIGSDKYWTDLERLWWCSNSSM